MRVPDGPRRRRTRAAALACLALSCTMAMATAPAAVAANKRVTFAARVCDSYGDIFANEARNNLMESLQQLGPDTPYPSSSAQMDPLTEDLPPQDSCRPLVGWRFTLGTAISPTKLTGVWGSLSQVANPYDTTISTHPSAPIRDPSGQPTGDQIKGAVTTNLTEDQESQAARSSLWVMGGTNAAPVGDATKYAFGALRCAVDNLNGDNVEFVSYPAGVEHVYCFAYYVSPPKGSGKIIVRKHLEGLPAGTPAQTFQFRGNISFTNDDPINHPDDGTFALTASPTVDGATTFVREAQSLWNFREVDPGPNFTVTVACTSQKNTSTIKNPDPNPARPLGVEVGLADGDTVTCTYTNTFHPPPVGLTVRKITEGGVGSFPMTVSGLSPFTLTTSQVGTPAEKTLQAEAGSTHTITETLPESNQGTWVLAKAPSCEGQPQRVRRGRGARSTAGITVTLPQRGGTVCTFVNRFIPDGRITIRKVTQGGTATATFYVEPQPQTEPPRRAVQQATTTAPDTPATARPVAPADSTARIPLGTYTIQELAPFADNGTWELTAVVCDGVQPKPAAAGAIQVQLTEDDPAVDCAFTDALAPEPEPLPPLPPEIPVPPVVTELPPPGIEVAGVVQRSSKADLVVRKVATPRTVVVGDQVRYLVTVRNRGTATARDVTLVEPLTPTTRVLRLRPSKGTCRGSVPRVCAIGILRPGETATVRVAVTTRRIGRFRNVVAATTSTEVRTLRTMRASARIRVLRAPGARFTG